MRIHDNSPKVKASRNVPEKGPETRYDFTTCESAQMILSVCYQGLEYRMKDDSAKERITYRNYEDSLPVYIQMVNFAYHLGCKSVLELGAGLSTGVWARFAANTGARVQSIEADLSAMWSYVNGSSVERLVREHVELHEAATISWNQLADFYGAPRNSLGDVPVSDFVGFLNRFFRSHPREKRITKSLGDWDFRIANLIVDAEGKLNYDRALWELYSDYDGEKALWENLESKGRVGVLEDLLEDGQKWDFVFFDSGERSSIIEWELLKSHIQIGGLAAFHDIFFPKSMKNFAVCASLLKDPNWRPVFLDESTRQGLFVAQRVL
jgi:hypothetical protein